jgi:hypothetical protein
MELKSKLIYLSIHSLGDGFTIIVIGQHKTQEEAGAQNGDTARL